VKSNMLLLIGIPLVFIAVIFAFETKQPLWLFLAVPVWVVRWFVRRELKKSEFAIRRAPNRPDLIDTQYIAQHDSAVRSEPAATEHKR
jgi:uncharacterized membrane protein YbhN (UPF0104 family)